MKLTRVVIAKLTSIEWAALAAILVGVSAVAYGVRGFIALGRFGVADAGRVALLLVPACLYLLVTSYVLQHARLVVLIPVGFGIMASIGSPSFALAVGIALIGIMVVPIVEQWRDSLAGEPRQPPPST